MLRSIDSKAPQGGVPNADLTPPERATQAPRHQPDAAALDPLVAVLRLAGRGLSVTPVPDLLADWQGSTIHETVGELDALLRFGRRRCELDEEQERKLRADLLVTYDPIRAEIAGTPEKRDATIDHVVKSYGALLRGEQGGKAAPDPFRGIAAGDPRALEGERVLWQTKDLMVLVDVFAEKRGSGPKVLVVPKRPMMFPTEAPAGLLQTLARVAAATGDALAQAGRSSQKVDVWINPPQALTVRQLHVHVQPHLPPWRDRGLTPKRLEGEWTRFYGQVEALLAQRLGPSAR
jgi:diadenosine tetraphosphate (Ap4A) HIT family hydrolase